MTHIKDMNKAIVTGQHKEPRRSTKIQARLLSSSPAVNYC